MPQTSPMNWMMISLLPMMMLKFLVSPTSMNSKYCAKMKKNLKFTQKWMW